MDPSWNRLIFVPEIKYDIRNNFHPLEMTTLYFLAFYSHKTANPRESQICVCYSPCLPPWARMDPSWNRLIFVPDIKYGIRNNFHPLEMTTLYFLAFYSHKTANPRESQIFVCYSPCLPTRARMDASWNRLIFVPDI